MRKAAMMLRPKRKGHYSRFDGVRNLPQALLLAGLFGFGLWMAMLCGFLGVVVYLMLWAASYPVIYAGACRCCAYYGEKCPIPLEGSWVHRFFDRSPKPFGYAALFWALTAYGMRAAMPVAVIIIHGVYIAGLLYAVLFAAFWIVHLRISGCPNCINTACPLSPADLNDSAS